MLSISKYKVAALVLLCGFANISFCPVAPGNGAAQLAALLRHSFSKGVLGGVVARGSSYAARIHGGLSKNTSLALGAAAGLCIGYGLSPEEPLLAMGGLIGGYTVTMYLVPVKSDEEIATEKQVAQEVAARQILKGAAGQR